MQYMQPVIDLDTGKKAWLDLGDHLPLSDVAKMLGVGPRRFRAVLVHMGILHREWDDHAKEHRNRLTPGAVQSRFGFRHDNKGFRHDPDRSPFDVLSPLGVEYVREHLASALIELNKLPKPVQDALARLEDAQAKRQSEMTPEMRVYWFADHYPELDAAHVAKGLGISEALVHRYRGRRVRQIRDATESAALAATWQPIEEAGPTEGQIADLTAALQATSRIARRGVET